MIKVESIKDGATVRMKVSDYRKRKADAYAAGTSGHPYGFEFTFEKEYWLKGELDNARLKSEISEGLR